LFQNRAASNGCSLQQRSELETYLGNLTLE
jgi:hypothetical protein